jgi:MFS family permease
MSEPAAIKSNDAYAVLRVKEFRAFILARFLFTISIQIQTVAVGWQIYELTKDPLSLGLIGLAEVIPAVGVSLYAGYIADKLDRRQIVLLCLAMLGGCSLALSAFTLTEIQALVPLSSGVIYTIIFMTGLARGFMSPATSAYWTQLVPRALYAKAASWNSATWETGSISGPALGGIMYGWIGATSTYALAASLLFIALILFFLLPSKPLPQLTSVESILESIRSGLKFVFRNEILISAISLDMFAVLFGGAVALLPIYAADILKVGPEGLGLLRAAPAVGALMMALFLAHRSIGENAGKKLLLCVAGFGVCMIAFGISTNFYLSIAVLMLSGVFDAVSVIIRSTIMQITTPDEMRGRVSSVNSIFIGSSNELGAFESGVAAKLLGVVPSVIFGGGMTLLVAAITAVKAKKLLRLEL